MGGCQKGIISRREFVKPHIVTGVKGKKMCPVQLQGQAHDLPVVQEMIKRVPDGAEHAIQDRMHTKTTQGSAILVWNL